MKIYKYFKGGLKMKSMIEISNATKKYKETTALNEISLMNETR